MGEWATQEKLHKQKATGAGNSVLSKNNGCLGHWRGPNWRGKEIRDMV